MNSLLKKTIKQYSYQYLDWRKTTIKQLEKKHNRILRGKPPIAIRNQLIPLIDLQLDSLQQELAEFDALKSGIRWRGNGEKSAGYLKRIHQTRTIQQMMTAIKLTTNISIKAVPPENNHTTDLATMREVVKQYYQQLYSVDQVMSTDIDNYLQTINLVGQWINQAMISYYLGLPWMIF